MADPERPPTVPPDAERAGDGWIHAAKKDGRFDGLMRRWNAKGVLVSSETMVAQGGRVGPFSHFYDDGSPASTGFWNGYSWGAGHFVSWAPPGSKDSWRPNMGNHAKVPGVIRRVEAEFANGTFTELKYFDAEENACGARGKPLDKAVAKAKKKAEPSDQEKLAALAGLTLPPGEKK